MRWGVPVQTGDEYMIEGQIIDAWCKGCGAKVTLAQDSIVIIGEGEAPSELDGRAD